MPFTANDSYFDCVNFSGLLTLQEVLTLANNSALQTLQFDSPVDRNNWPLLEEHLFRQRPDVCLRAYGYYFQPCDISFLKELPSLQNFKVDCNRKVSGLQTLEVLENLHHLSVGVDELDNFDFLSNVSAGLKTLTLGPTFSTKPDLAVLSRFQQLEELFIGGHHKSLEPVMNFV